MTATAPLGTYLTAFLVGILGGVHCLGMCGGIVGSLTLGLAPDVKRHPLRLLPFQLTCNLARVAGYALAGTLAGTVGAILLQSVPLQTVQRVLYGATAVMMLLLGLYLAGWWRALAISERLGLHLWQRVQPLMRRLLPVRSLPQAAAIGLLWAWIPCGLVYSVLIMAVASGNPLDGALLMAAFGLGTLPTLLGIGLLAGMAARIIERRWVRQLAGALVIGFGLHALWQLVAA